MAQIAKKGQKQEKITQEQHYRDTLKTLQTALSIATEDYQKAIAQCETIALENSKPLPAPNFKDFAPVGDLAAPGKQSIP
jgi:hypothetical protein